MGDMKADQMALANPLDWCTVRWAADKLSVDERTVRRMLSSGVLRRHYPRKSRTEDPNHAVMIYVADVERVCEARRVMSGSRA